MNDRTLIMQFMDGTKLVFSPGDWSRVLLEKGMFVVENRFKQILVAPARNVAFYVITEEGGADNA